MKRFLLTLSSLTLAVATSLTAMAMDSTAMMATGSVPTQEVLSILGVVSITTVVAWSLHRWDNK